MINETATTYLTGTRFSLEVTDWNGNFTAISEFTSLESAQAERESTRFRYPDHEFRIVQITTTSEIVDTDEDFKAQLDQNTASDVI